MIDKLTGSLQLHEQALYLRDQRQQVLSSNIANADTPGYKARDFDFASELQRASKSQSASAQGLQQTHNRHLNGQGPGATTVQNMQYRTPAQNRLDGNTVDMDLERTRFADNSVRHQAAITLLDSRIKGLKSAMQPE